MATNGNGYTPRLKELYESDLRARLKDLAPIGVMLQRGLLKGSTASEHERELKELYRIDDIYQEPELLLAARRSKADEEVSSTQLAWVACVRRAAEGTEVEKFDPDALGHLANRLTQIVAALRALSVVDSAERVKG